MRLLFASAIAASVALAQGTEPKPGADDYPAHGKAGGVSIGAEYMVRSIGTPKGSFLSNDYLVVEVALYPQAGPMMVNAQQWTIRLNGKKEELMTQTPGMVAASLKYPDWSYPRRMDVAAGPVTIGPPVPVERFPGDNRPAQNRIPGQVPRVPTTPETGIEQEPVDLNDVIARAALPEGQFRGPVSGYLFFPWRGNPAKIKSVDLLFRPESAAPLTLRIR